MSASLLRHHFLLLRKSAKRTLSRLRGKSIIKSLRLKVKSAKFKRLIPTSMRVTKAIANNVQRYFKVPTETKAKYHFFGASVASIALGIGLIVGGWQIYKAVFALTETTKTMPADIQFNRGLVGSLASYLDDEGKIEVATDSIKLAKVGSWWNESYKYRKQITLKNLSSASISTSSAQITVDTKALVDSGKLLANCNDLRVAKQASSGASMVEQPRSFTPASGTINCSDSTATIVTFSLTETFASNATSSAYFLYYGNASATTPSYPKEKYLSFDGTNDFVQTSYAFNSNISSTGGGYTWAAWIYPEAAGSIMTSTFDSNYADGTSLSVTSNTVLAWSGLGTNFTANIPTGLYNKWSHVVGVAEKINASTIEYKIYVNGVLVGSTSSTKTFSAPNRNIRIGLIYAGYTQYGLYKGKIDEIAIYGVPLNNEDISEIYNNDNSSVSSLNLYYKFNDISGQSINDSSGNGRTGSLGIDVNSASDDPSWVNSLFEYSLDNKNATMICPFNGSTTCTTGQTPTTATGAIRYTTGSAMLFDGLNDKITIPSITATYGSNALFTAEFWVKPDPKSYGLYKGILGAMSSGWNAIAYNSATDFRYAVNDGVGGQGFSWAIIDTTNQWTHFALTFDKVNSQVTLYQNGINKGTKVITTASNQSFTYIGGQTVPNDYFHGLIDEVRISDNIRYTGDFTPQTAPFEPDSHTKLLYHFDENGDDPRNTGKAIDASGNGNHGTISGAKYTNDSPVKNGSYASHEGVFIEEGTTNLITNPSFENASATLNWGPSHFTYATASATFTPSMAKRNSAGPFAAGPMVQGDLAGTTGDQLSTSLGNQLTTGFYQNFDQNQGSISFWVTPEWNGNDGKHHYLVDWYGGSAAISKDSANRLNFYINGGNVALYVDASSWLAGSTYNIVARWDSKNTIDGTNYMCLSVNDTTTCGVTTHPNVTGYTTLVIGGATNAGGGKANAIIEGLTVYRRVLFDGIYGTDVGNGDEINLIWGGSVANSKDPTLVTGSWDVVFALPTNGATGALATGTGNAWSMPHNSNLLGGTNGKNGFMTSADAATDGFTVFAPNKLINGAFDNNLDNWTATPSYSLNDTFTTATAAGSVNGTLATDGVNTRTVVDTTNNISIDSGVLNFSGGHNTYGNPRITYPTVTRSLGKIISGKVNISTNNHGNINAWSTSWIQPYQIWFGGANLGGVVHGANDIYYADVARASGDMWFSKTGSGPWTLQWISGSGTGSSTPYIESYASVMTADNIRIPTSTWLPAPLVYDTFATDSATLSESIGPDNQATPQLTWTGGTKSGGIMSVTPSLGSDIFSGFNLTSGWTATNLTPLSANTFSTSAYGYTNKNMPFTLGTYYQFDFNATTTAGTLNLANYSNGSYYPILSGNTMSTYKPLQTVFSITNSVATSLATVNTMTARALTLSSLFSTVSTSDSDLIADTNINWTTNTQAGLVLNLDSATTPSNFVIAYLGRYNDAQNFVYLDKYVNGVWTNLIATGVTYNAGATLRVIKDGTKYRVYYNNSLVGSEQTISDTEIISNTKHGLFSTYSGNTFDNFIIWPRGSGTTKFTSAPFEELTVSRDTGTKYAGASSVKLVAGGTDANYLQSVNVGDIQDYTFTTYAYTTGAAVTSADLNLYYDTATLSSTITSTATSGWYKLTGSFTGITSTKSYGVRIKAGKTVYLDSMSVQATTGIGSATTLATTQKIFGGGYAVMGGLNEGMYRDITVTAGQDLVIRGIANSDGVSQPKLILYDQTNDAEIGSLTGTTTSTKNAPDVLLFTGEAPSGCTTVRVKLVNAVSTSATVNWHQVEVYNNAISNPSMESGSGDPFLPTGWSNLTLNAGDSEQESLVVHSGVGSVQYNSGVASNETMRTSHTAITSGKYAAFGGWEYGNGSVSQKLVAESGQWALQATSTTNPILTSSIASWNHVSSVMRRAGASGLDIFLYGNGAGPLYFDDIYIVPLDDVSLTATPATQANSTETSGLRVDGADTLTQPITGLTATNGVIKFKFTPRHSLGSESYFGYTEYNTIAEFKADNNNTIVLRRSVSNPSIQLYGYFNGSIVNGASSTLSLDAGTTYTVEISYQSGGNLTGKINGINVVSTAGVVNFASVPSTAYFGANSSGTVYYDATITSFTTSSVTENSTSPYYKFGSKSVKIQAYDSPDQYVTTATASANARNTVSAYIYDNTTGNVGGVVDSNVVTIASGSTSLASSYVDQGGGWWRVSYTDPVNIPAGTYNWGVQVQAGKTVYIDGIQAEQKAYSTTYADGSLGAGYTWTGTANASTSTRTTATVSYPISIANSNSGTMSIWVKPNMTEDPTLDIRQSYASIGNYWNYNSILLKRHGPSNGYKMQFGQSFTSPYSTITKDNWVQLVATWNNGTANFYLNGVYKETLTGSVAALVGNIYIGGDNNGSQTNGSLSDFRLFDQPLSATEITSLYNQGLITHQNGTEASDRYAALGTYTSPVMDLGANGQWGASAWNATATLGGGTVEYATRTSADNSVWSSWETVVGSTIASLPRRYLQWRADLTPSTGATVESPVISGMTVKFVEDTTPPVNPAEIAQGYSSSATASANLISGNWYNYATPKFTWDSADDQAGNGQSASGIDSYYVFFTQDADATPSANVADDCFRQTTELDRSITIGTTPALCHLTDGTYYLRLQSKDNSGNMSDPVTLFTYLYDGSIPNAPASVSTTSVGYTSNNAFTFFWPVATDNGPSGVKGYEYKTGTSSGAFADWTFTTGTTATDVSAYQEGQNFFLVRTVDTSNNVSGSTSNNVSMASFYYNASAPTQPQNVNISPDSSENIPSAANVFDVSWDKPATFSGEIAKYYYCVNCTPSVNTMTETTAAETVNRSLTNIALATQQGKNTLFIVAEDNNLSPDTGHGNRNFDAYASADFYASTVAPAAPTSLVVSDASDRDALIWRLTLTWKAPATGGTPKIYHVYRAEGEGEYTKLGETTSTAYTDADLTQSTKYSYKVRAVDNAGSLSLFSAVVIRSPEGKYTAPPTAGGVPTSTSGSTTATIKWTTSRTSFGTVEYGKTTDYGSAATETTATKDHVVKITGLAPGISYHYRVQSLDDSSMVDYNRVDAYSADYTFTTLNTAAVTGIEVTDIGLDSAVVTWKTSSLSTSKVEYGATLTYGKSIDVSSSASESAHTTRLSGLTHSTIYHFRVRGTTNDGDDIFSEDNTFQTTTFPKVTALVMNTDQDAAGTTIVLAWSTNVPTTAEIVYQAAAVDETQAKSLKLKTSSEELQKMTQIELATVPVIPRGAAQTLYSGELLDKHIQRISGLTDGSIYIFTIRGRDEKGNQAISDPIRYVTGADTRPPNLQNVIIETPMNGVGADAKAQIIISWETDEPSTSQILWGAGTGSEYPQASEKEAALTTKHVVVLRDLLPTSSYHLKIMSSDKTGNLAESKDTVVVTPSSQQAAFDIIIKNLEDVFGFLKL